MVPYERDNALDFIQALSTERRRLVGLCAHLTNCADVAEDLAQETLVEAWRHIGALRDEAGRTPWLNAIARHVCLRWMRTQGREMRYGMVAAAGAAVDPVALLETQAADVDVEIELERAELADLLDRALALLPPPTRAMLVDRYVHESPIAEIATRLGCSEGATAKKIARGRLTLHRLFTTDLRQEAEACGLPVVPTPAWQETRIWCTHCGTYRLNGRFVVQGDTAEFVLRCPACFAASGLPATDARGARVAHLVRGVQGYKPALSRLSVWALGFYQQGLLATTVPCAQCGQPALLRRCLPDDAPSLVQGTPGMHVFCPACRITWWTTLSGLALWLPAGRRFWRRYPRIRLRPLREVEVAGRDAVVISFESMTDAAQLDVIYARDTYTLLGVHGD